MAYCYRYFSWFVVGVTLSQVVLNYNIVDSVVLDEIVGEYIERILKDFSLNSRSSFFDNVIQPPLAPAPHVGVEEISSPRRQDFLLPKLFIWSPLDHFGLQIRCPEHGAVLQVGQWTSVTCTKNVRNPRLVFDLGGNILLIQRFYTCSHRGFRHRYLSGSEAIIRYLPAAISALFPIRIYHRSCFTKDLLHLTETLVLEGVNFMQICDTIASMNFRSFCQKNQRYVSFLSTTSSHEIQADLFYQDLMFSFPSDRLLTYMYLEHFQELKPLYEQEMANLEARSITCDHTFRVSKNIGSFRSADGRFVKKFGFLFILLNERNEVIEWRLTKSTAFSEITDLLESVNVREGINLESIVVDNCCHVRKQYQNVVGAIPVKLDLFHAVQRVTNSLTKGTEFSKQFCKEFSLVFRNDGDVGKERTLPTPEEAIILRNMESFCERWANVLSKIELSCTMDEIVKLKQHITRGCLSGIGAGEGTAGNERLHRSLNRSLLCGASVISPDLAIAVLTALFYTLNCKRSGAKHFKNARVVPSIPVELCCPIQEEKRSNTPSSVARHMKISCEPDCIDNHETVITENPNCTTDADFCDNVVIADKIEHLLEEHVAKEVIETASRLHKVFQEMNSCVTDKSVNFFDVPLLEMFASEKVSLSTNETDLFQSHNLNRSLAAFGLSIDSIAGDGDCAFSSIVRQLYKLPEFADNESRLRQHLSTLGLGKTPEEDTLKLRQLFVDQVQSFEHYQLVIGIAPERLNDETELFREPGTFSGNLGDLVMRVCADVIQVPIVVITSLSTFPYTTFVPDGAIITSALYLAFNATGPGHYDATQRLVSKKEGCSCGKNKSRGGKVSCNSRTGGRECCPCVRKGECCTRSCICKNCCNVGTTSTIPVLHTEAVKCRCGQTSTKKGGSNSSVYCKDGVKKSKCPCLGKGQGCSSACRCVGCGNIHGTNSRVFIKSQQGNRKRTQAAYKRPKGSVFLSSSGISSSTGPWTSYESLLLAAVIKIITLTAITPSPANIAELFNHAVHSRFAKELQFPLVSKTTLQISAKLEHYKRKHEVDAARLACE